MIKETEVGRSWPGRPFLKNHASPKGPAALTDCSPGRKAELLRPLPRVRNRPGSHAHAGALQEANPSGLTGQPDPEVYPVGPRRKWGVESGW